MAFLRLFRLPNLLILVITVWIFAFLYIYPAFRANDIIPVLSLKDFYLLIFIVICLTAAGYLHNDIVDRKVDMLNEDVNFIDSIGLGVAYIFYTSLVIGPFPFALSLAIEIGHLEYIWLYLGIILLLFGYNRYLKRIALLGNFVIATLCSAVIWLIYLGEWDSLVLLATRAPADFRFINEVFISFTVFAFIVNFLREIVKDVEDLEGDKSFGHKTLPIIAGPFQTRKICIVILVGLGLSVLGAYVVLQPTLAIALTGSVVLLLPLGFLVHVILSARDKADYSRLSAYLKSYMVLGLCFLIFLSQFADHV